MTRRPHLAAIVALAAVAAGPLAAAPAAAQPCEGVEIVIDPGTLDGDVRVLCAEGDHDSGVDALTAAGVSWEYVQRFPGMVCRIDGQPDEAATDCVDAPPADTYWSYWVGGDEGWTSSQLGAHQRTPQGDEVEGWVFGDGDPPSLDPTAELEPVGEERSDAAASTGTPDTGGPGPSTGVIAGVLALVLVAALALRQHRRRTQEP